MTTTPDRLKLARDALAPCPFCGNRPYLTVRPDNAEATTYFAAVACFCGGYSACAHKMATAPQADEAETLARTAWNRRAAIDALPASVPSGEPAAKKPHGCEHRNGQFCGKAGPCLYPKCAPTVPAAPAPAAVPDAQALRRARWEGVQSVRAQTAEIVRAALELLDAAGESFPPDALAAFKRVFGGAAPAVAAPEPVQRGWLIEWPTPGSDKRRTLWSDSDTAAKAIGCPHEPVYVLRRPTTQEPQHG